MNITELLRHMRNAKRGTPEDEHDRYFVRVSPRDYFLLHRQCHPRIDPPSFNVYLEQGYISIEPDLEMPDGDIDIVVD